MEERERPHRIQGASHVAPHEDRAEEIHLVSCEEDMTHHVTPRDTTRTSLREHFNFGLYKR
ncbi:hypothetical protein EYF80_065247 [Liparis tanakae]|uniref:Uncharacterized protein n=1 Tax=Liparis tanakae TaxID=230148 RepID=A0A4Z2E6S5_9TELE|nr:hypothetical protein EYF80_065247 [Liparis tanakae]